MKATGREKGSEQISAARGRRRAEPRVHPAAAKLASLRRQYKETLEQQAATAEILRVISGSPADIQPVLNAVVQSAARLCDARDASIFRVEGSLMRRLALCGRRLTALKLGGTRPVTRGTVSGRAILDRRTMHVRDVRVKIDTEFPELETTVEQDHVRTIVAVPLLHEGKALGAITVFRREVRPFTRQQIALLKTFADQAVIALENVRLFNETKEALERQTATAEILRVISESPTDVAPVFETILSNAGRLCDSKLSAIFRFDGKLMHLAATHNWSPEALAKVGRMYPMAPDRSMTSGRTILTKSIVRLADTHADTEYSHDSAAAGGWRRMLGVPMLREGEPIGAFVVAWPEPGETPEHHVQLLKTFADQAVIAIENVRLFNETKEALEQQKASADVLGAISSSIADTKPVFDKILESCERLFEGQLVGVTLAEGDMVQLVAYHGRDSEKLKTVYPLPLTRESGTGCAILDATVAHYPDVSADGVPPAVVAGCRTLDVRSIIFAPMLFEGRGIGAIWVARTFVGAFTQKQIAQLRTFADQAVIAIQNARLFREIQEKSRQLEAANKHKSEFLANMSHELRTPLNAIIGFSEVLMERMFGEVNEKQADYLKDIHESGRHLLSLINDILDLSKIEAGRMELELASVHLPTAISNAMTLVRERAQRHGIQLGLEVDQRLGEFQVDERKLKQILLNLLSNAVKFTPDGGRVDVSAKLDTDKVEIAVRDSGIGISPQDQAMLFEEFKQVGRDAGRKAEGTGLGLALTKRFVELHGGEIRVDSAPGKGSTFTVMLPLR